VTDGGRPARARRSRRSTGTDRPPWPFVVLAAVGTLFFALPFLGLLWRVPWGDVWGLLTEESSLQALKLSLVCSLSATALSILLGVPLAWVLARVGFPGRRFVRALCVLSMVLPPVVGGVALFAAFGRRGLVGGPLYDWFGWRITFTTVAVVLAETFVAMPFLVLSVEAGLRGLDRRPEEAARTLGAGRWYTFRRVTLPAVRPALVAGAVLAWARALGEFGATITFAGNLPGKTQTMPLAVYLALESDTGQALVLSLVLIVVSFAVLVGLRDRWLGGDPENLR
jgi:molybdate transport system permease protein